MWVIIAILIIAMIFVASVRPNRSTLSEYELSRRSDKASPTVSLEHMRHEYYDHIMTLRRIKIGVLTVLVIILLVVSQKWLTALIGGVLLMLFYPRLGQISMVRKYPQRLYDKHERWMLEKVARFAWLVKPFMTHTVATELQLASREEFAHVVEESGHVLDADEKKLFTSALQFDTKLVADCMTPRSVIDSVSVDELLGPLVLDDLHKTGHSHFPVIDGDIDHVVGLLHVQDLMVVQSGASQKVRDVMDKKVYYIHEGQTLKHALTACIKTKRHLLVVVNEYRETVGLLSLEDVMEALLGRKIVDQFDAHDDLRKVAERNPRGNNKPPQALDV